MLVDTERVLLQLKGFIALKTHHGQRDLLAEIARLEVSNQLEEGLPEKAVRLYGGELTMALLQPPSAQGRVPEQDGATLHVLRGDSHNEGKHNVGNQAGLDAT